MTVQNDDVVFVRCTACHTVYEQPPDPGAADPQAGCPECQETLWIAVDIPLSDVPPQPPA